METGQISQKISLKPKPSERRQFVHRVSQSSSPSLVVPSSETPVRRDGIIYGIFGDRSLLFLGVISSILALSMALWSIHRNSDMSRRLNNLNSSLVDLIVKQRAAPVVEVGRRELDPKASKLGRFKEEREARKRESANSDPLKDTVEEINLYNREQERERTDMLERIRRESDENIRRMELASKEALAESKRHTVSTKQLSERVSRLQIKTPDSTDVPYSSAAEGIISGISQIGEGFVRANHPKQMFVDDIDVDDLENDLRLLTGQ